MSTAQQTIAEKDSADKVNQKEQRAHLRTGAAIFMLGTLIAALYVFVFYGRLGVVEARIDLNGFGLLGRHIAWGDGFSYGAAPTMRRAPLYPAFIALILKLSGNAGPEVPDAI